MMAGLSPVQDSSAQLLRHSSACFGTGRRSSTVADSRNFDSETLSIWGEHSGRAPSSPTSSTSWNGYSVSFSVANKNKNAVGVTGAGSTAQFGYVCHENGTSPFPQVTGDKSPVSVARCQSAKDMRVLTDCPSETLEGKSLEVAQDSEPGSSRETLSGNKIEDAEVLEDKDVEDISEAETCGQCLMQFPSMKNYLSHICAGGTNGTEEDDDQLSNGETFEGRIVYNPDGSAYIIEGELEANDTESLVNVPKQEGAIVEHRDKVIASSNFLSYPQIASAVYIRCPPPSSGSGSFFLNPSNVWPRSEVPVMHSYRVYDFRSGKQSELEKRQDFALRGSVISASGNMNLIPTKPVLMCFICKLSFGYVKSFVTHASVEHSMTLNNDERTAIFSTNASALIQNVGPEKIPHMSFLEPVTSLPRESGCVISPTLSMASASSPQQTSNALSWKMSSVDAGCVVAEPPGPHFDPRGEDSLEQQDFRQNQRSFPEPTESKPGCVEGIPEFRTSMMLQDRPGLSTSASREQVETCDPNVPSAATSQFCSSSSSLWGQRKAGHPDEKNNNSISNNTSEPQTTSSLSSAMFQSLDFGKLYSSSSILEPSVIPQAASSAAAAAAVTSQTLHLSTSSNSLSTSQSLCPISSGGSGTLAVGFPSVGRADTDHLLGMGAECEPFYPVCDRSPAGQLMASLHSRNSCKTLKCPKCNWHYKYQETLEIHMKEKHPEAETQCVYCISGQPHPRLARGESYTCGYKPYRCDICNYSTTTKGNLSIHLQSDKHSNNMQELQNGGAGGGGSGAGPISDTKLPPTTPSNPTVASASPSVGGAGGAPARKNKQKAMWRCDFCSYETTEARNLRIHMTSEKHAHNLMALQQNMRQMQMNHQMALFGQDPSLLGLPPIMGLQPPPPPPPPSAFDPSMFMPAFLPSLPEIAMDLTKPNLAGTMERDGGGPKPDSRSGMFVCAICNAFSTDTIDLLQHHIQLDRSKSADNDSVTFVGGTYLCNLCQYRTTLKANFQLHCKTDKHLQRLQLINHIQEGGTGPEMSQKLLSSAGSPVQVWCSACDYHTNSIYRLQMHVVGSSHEANARLFAHLQLAEAKLPVSVRRSYRCTLCGFAGSTRFSLIEHGQSESHAIKEQLNLVNTHGDLAMSEETLDNFCVVVEEDDSVAESDAEDSVASCGEAEARHRTSSYDALDDSLDDMKRCKGDGPSLGSSSTSLGPGSASETGTVSLPNELEQVAGQDGYRSGAVACILCWEPIDSRDQLQHHLLEVHKVKAETLQSIMRLADAADQMTLPSISTTPAPPSDAQKPHTGPSTDAAQNTPEEPFQTLHFEAGDRRRLSLSESVLPASVSGVASPSTFHWKQPEMEAGKNKDGSSNVVESEVRQNEGVHDREDVSVDGATLSHLEPDDHCRCQTCLRKFPTIDALYSHQNELGHLELKQTQTGPGYLCWHKGCSQYFKTANAVQVHHREVHVVRPIQELAAAPADRSDYQHRCGQCSLAFKTVDQLQVHSYYHVIRSAADCVVCGKSFQSASEAKTHLEKCHVEALTQEQMAKYQAHAAVASSLALLGASCLDGLSSSFPMTSEAAKPEENRPMTSQTESVSNRSDESQVPYCRELLTLKSEEPMDYCGREATPKLDENSNANLSDAADEGIGTTRLLQQGFDDYVASRSEGDGNYSALKYKCHRCKVGFPKMSCLSAHNKTLQHRQGSKLSHPLEKYFDPNRPYKCEVCMESFTQKNILLVHYNSVSHLHRLKQQQQQQQTHHTTTPQTLERGESSTEPLCRSLNEDENVAVEEMEVDAEDVPRQETTSDMSLLPAAHFSVITSIGKAIPVTSICESKVAGDSNTVVAKSQSSSVFDKAATSVGVKTTADEQPMYRCELCLIHFDSRSAFEAHMCQNFQKSRSERLAEMSNHQLKPTVAWLAPNRGAFSESGAKFPAAQWPVMQSSTSLMSTSVASTASIFNSVFPTSATVSLATSGHLSLLTAQSLIDGAQGKAPGSTGLGPAATGYLQRGQNTCICHRCGAMFASLEFLTQHQQLPCGGADSSGTISSSRPTTAVRQEGGLSAYKPRIHHTLLQNFGFDCVMQFNECRQKTSKDGPNKDLSGNGLVNSFSFPNTEIDRPRETDEKVSGESSASVEKPNDDELPELRRCICCLCWKEFSSVWVLKAHEEEVHRELLPSNLIQEFGKQFRKFYESRHQMVEAKGVADLVTKSSLPTNRKQDFGPVEHTSKSEENQTHRTSGLSSAEMTAQMMQLPLMMGLNLLPPPMLPMMMPLGAELFGLSPFSLMDPSMLMLPQGSQKPGAVAVSSQSSVAVPQKSARTRITDEQLSVLRAHFDINNSPSEEQIRDMSEKTGLLPKVIKHWFRNTLFKERQRNKDSPYNFSNPPSTTLNLEEYEKLTQSMIKKERPTENKDEQGPTETLTSTQQFTTLRTESCIQSGQSSHLDSKETENRNLATLKGPASAALPSMDALPRLAFPPPLLSSGGDLSAAVLSNLMHMPPIFLPSPVLSGSSSAAPKVSGMGYNGGGAGSQVPGMVYSGANAASQERRANRTRFTKHQIRVLQDFFEQNAYPKDDELENLSKLLDLSPRVIVVWFQNARQKVRKNFENQPPVDMSEEGTSTTGAAAQIPFPTGSNYQCKKCLATFPHYEELVKHKQNVCFKDEENCYVSVSNSAVSGEVSDDDEDRGDGASRSSIGSESKGFGGAGAGSGIEYCCEKCNLVFYHLEKWKEHQSIHAASLGLAVPQISVASLTGKNKNYDRERDRVDGFGGTVQEEGSQGKHWSDDGDERDDQPRDKRIRTTILPEQLDYLYHKYQSDCNPSRKQLDAIAARVGLKKRVVQVWFQNTRARERKGQYRAHQQLIHKRCPFCKALFRAKTALEAHLMSKHPEEMARRDINIDTIPDEPTETVPQLDSPMLGSNTGGALPNFAKGCPGTSSSYSMSNSFLSGIQNMRSLGSTELLHPNMQRLYEDSFKKYIDELSHASHQSKPEPGMGLRPELTSNAASRIKQEDSPLDLSMSMKPGADERRPFEDNPGLGSAISRPYLREDSHSESHSEDNNDDWCGLGAESGPPSPSSSASNQSKPAQGGMPGKRYRTQMSSLQIKVMKSVFADYKTPTMAECEALGREIGLPKRVVQVWFQNARAKEKKWNMSGAEGTAAGASSLGAVASPLAAASSNYCSLCDVTYSLQLTVQDHLFTRNHIDNVKANLHCQKEAASRRSAAAAAQARDSGGSGKTADGDTRTSVSRVEPALSTSTCHQGLVPSMHLHSTPVNHVAGLPSQGSDKRQKNGGTMGHRVKLERGEILKSPNTDAPLSSVGLPPGHLSTSGAVIPSVTSAVNHGHMIAPFGGFPILPGMPNPADMMSMMPYLFPCLTGFYPGAGMPFMPTSMVPGLESMFMYDPVNFGTPLSLLQIPPTCIKKIQEKLQEKDCTVTHYAQDCHSFADLRRCVAPEDWLVARRATVDVGYICKKCHIVYPGRAACVAHQQMSCFAGAPPSRPDGMILKLEQLQYECSACLVRCSTVSEFKVHCSQDPHQRHLAAAAGNGSSGLMSQKFSSTMAGNAMTHTKVESAADPSGDEGTNGSSVAGASKMEQEN